MSDTTEASGPRGLWGFWLSRFVVFFVVLAAVYIGCQVGRGALLRYEPGIPRNAVLLGEGFAIALLATSAYRLLVRWTEHRSATELGFRGAIPLALGGAAIGLVLFLAVYAGLFALGVASFAGWGTTENLLAMFAGAFGAAFGEEILMRGGVFRLLEEGFGTIIAVVLSGALFGFLHSGNPGATLESSVAIALEAGVLLAAAYAVTRSLWLPIGLHFGWNFTEGGIFGEAVSGGASKGGLIHAPLLGPDALTGGQFGPEASIVAVSISFVASLVMLVLAAQRGHWKPVRFRLRGAGEA
ncbi:MAG TPA: type II CAAX endopeptidase family protein [Rhizomicrobium sp.]|nr:type II CAAX endopeptidase family protein [Rhizomicrobium sp.]